MKNIAILTAATALLFQVNWTAIAADNKIVHTAEVYKEVNNTKLKIDIFHGEDNAKDTDKTAIVFFHGGGWAFGEPKEFYSTCERYAKMGIVTFSVAYRLCTIDGRTPHPDITPVESLMDAKSAMRWVRKNAERFGINPEKIVAAGQSVGGHLALSTFMIEDHNEATDDLAVSAKPNALLMFSGTVNTVEAWADHLLADRREQIWSISPAHNINPDVKLPPVIHFHGTADDVVALWKIKFFIRDLGKLGEAYELREYEGRKHYLGDGNPKYSRYYDDEILLEVDAFLRKNGLLE